MKRGLKGHLGIPELETGMLGLNEKRIERINRISALENRINRPQ